MKSNKYFIVAVLVNLILGNLIFSYVISGQNTYGFEFFLYFVHSCVAFLFIYLLFKIAKTDFYYKSIVNSFLFSYLIPVISIDIILIFGCIKDNNFDNLPFMLASTFFIGILLVSVFWIPFGFINAFIVCRYIKSTRAQANQMLKRTE